MALNSVIETIQIVVQVEGAAAARGELEKLGRLAKIAAGDFETLLGGKANKEDTKRALASIAEYNKYLSMLKEKHRAIANSQIQGEVAQKGMVQQLRARNEMTKDFARREAEVVKYAQMRMRAEAEMVKYGQMQLRARNEMYEQKAAPFVEQARADERNKAAIARLTGSQNAAIYASLSPVERLEYYVNRFKQVFRRVTDALISFLIINAVTRAVQGFFRSIVESNAILENLDYRLRGMVTRDGTFVELRKHILDLTVKTPFIIKDFADATVTLTAFGLSAKQNLAPVANWAAAIGRELGDVALAFAKVSQGSPRTALLLSTRGISKQEFDTEVKRTHDAALALRNIIERNFGDMAFRVSMTFKGLISNIKDLWVQVSLILGQDIFKSLKRDVQTLYDVMSKMTDQTSAFGVALRGVSVVISALYTILKAVLPMMVALFAMKGASQFITMMRESGKFLTTIFPASKFAQSLSGQMTLAHYGLVAGLAVVIDSLNQARVAAKNFDEAQREMMKGGEKGSQILIDRLYRYKEALEGITDVQPMMVQIAKFVFQTGLDPQKLVAATAAWMTAKKAGIEATKQEIEENEKLRASYKKLQEAREDVYEIKDIYQIVRQAQGVQYGKEAMDVIEKRLEESKASLTARLTSPYTGQNDITDIQASLIRVNRELDNLSKRDWSAEQFGIAAFKKLKESLPGWITAIEKGTDKGVDIWKDLLGSLIEADKAAKKVDLAEQIADQIRRQKELRDAIISAKSGEEKLQVQINALKTREVELNKWLNSHAGWQFGTERQRLDFQKKRTQLLDAQLGIITKTTDLEMRIEHAKADAIEKRRDLEESIVQVKLKQLEYDYKMSGNLKVFNQARKDELRQVEDLIEQLRRGIQETRAKLGQSSIVESYVEDIFDISGYKSQAISPEVLNRMSKQYSVISGAAQQFNVPIELVQGIIAKESLGGLKTYNKESDAAGWMQLMRATAKDLGLTAEERFDPEKNIMAGTKYFAQQLTKYRGDIAKSLAAYNAGPARVDSALAKYGEEGWFAGMKDFQSPKGFRETQDYVKTILGYYKSMVPQTQEIRTIRKETANNELEVIDIQRRGTAQEKELQGLIMKRLELLEMIADQTSETFGEAFDKAARNLRNTLNSFYDNVASMILSGIQDVGVGIVHSLLFGEEDSGKEKRLADLRLELQQLYNERKRDAVSLQRIVRLEDESAERYLARMQAANEQIQRESLIYEYQTKELEILNRINEAEAERNSLILQRLQSLGEKILDAFISQMIGRVIGGFFPIGGGGGGGFTGGGGGGGGGGNPAPGQSGFLQPQRNVTIQFNGPVYGTRDFDMAIDNAMARIESKRGR